GRVAQARQQRRARRPGARGVAAAASRRDRDRGDVRDRRERHPPGPRARRANRSRCAGIARHRRHDPEGRRRRRAREAAGAAPLGYSPPSCGSAPRVVDFFGASASPSPSAPHHGILITLFSASDFASITASSPSRLPRRSTRKFFAPATTVAPIRWPLAFSRLARHLSLTLSPSTKYASTSAGLHASLSTLRTSFARAPVLTSNVLSVDMPRWPIATRTLSRIEKLPLYVEIGLLSFAPSIVIGPTAAPSVLNTHAAAYGP